MHYEISTAHGTGAGRALATHLGQGKCSIFRIELEPVDGNRYSLAIHDMSMCIVYERVIAHEPSEYMSQDLLLNSAKLTRRSLDSNLPFDTHITLSYLTFAVNQT